LQTLPSNTIKFEKNSELKIGKIETLTASQKDSEQMEKLPEVRQMNTVTTIKREPENSVVS